MNALKKYILYFGLVYSGIFLLVSLGFVYANYLIANEIMFLDIVADGNKPFAPFLQDGIIKIIFITIKENIDSIPMLSLFIFAIVGIAGKLLLSDTSSLKGSKKTTSSKYMSDVSESNLKGSAGLLDELPTMRESYNHYTYNTKTGDWRFYNATPMRREGDKVISGYFKEERPNFKEIKRKSKEEKISFLTAYKHRFKRPYKAGLVTNTIKDGVLEYYFFDDASIHSLILGMTGMGKTRTLYLPSFWLTALAGHSFVVTDVKGELIEMMSPFLQDHGYDVYLLNFDEPKISNSVNLMRVIDDSYEEFLENGDDSTLMTSVTSLMNTLIPVKGKDPFWENSAKATLTGILYTLLKEAPKGKKTISSLIKTYQECTTRKTNGNKVLPSILDEYYDLLDPKQDIAKGYLKGFITAQGTTYGSMESTLSEKVNIYNSTSVREMVSLDDVDLKQVGKKKTALFLNVPSKNDSYYAFIGILLNNLGLELMKVANANGGRLPIPVHFFLDEFGNVPRIEGFEKDITLFRSYGMRFNIALQSLGQLNKVYEKDADTIIGNCTQTIYMGTADLETNKKITERLGKYTRDTFNVSKSGSTKDDGRRIFNPSESYSTDSRDIFTPDELEKTFDKGNVLVMSKGRYPFAHRTLDLSQLTATKDLGFPILKGVKVKNLTEELKEIYEENKHKFIENRGKIEIDNVSLTSLVRAKRRVDIIQKYKRTKPDMFWILDKETVDKRKSQTTEMVEKENELDYDDIPQALKEKMARHKQKTEKTDLDALMELKESNFKKRKANAKAEIEKFEEPLKNLENLLNTTVSTAKTDIKSQIENLFGDDFSETDLESEIIKTTEIEEDTDEWED